MGAPQTLPANFGGWDKPPDTLPADFAQWDQQPAAKAPPKPGFIDRVTQGIPHSVHDFASMVGTPTSWHELADMMQKGQIPFDPGSAMVQSYLHDAKTAITQGAKEAMDAGANVAEGGPIAANIGKAASGGVHAALHLIPGVGPVTETAGQDVQEGNYPAAAGGLTNAIAQVLLAHGIEDPAVAAKVADVVDTLKSPTKMTAPVRAAVRGANKVLAKAPGTVGGSVGATVGGTVGGAVAGPLGAKIGAGAGYGAGYGLGTEVLPGVKLPGEGIGLPNRVSGGPANAPEFQPPAAAASTPAAPAPAATESPLDATREGDIQPVLQKAYRDTLVQKIANPDTPFDARIRATTELHDLDHPELKDIQPRGQDVTRQRFNGMQEPPAEAPSSTPSEPANASPAASQTANPAPISGEGALRQVLDGESKSGLEDIARTRGVEVKPSDSGTQIANKIIDDFSDDELDGVRTQVQKSSIKPSVVEQQLRDALGGSGPLKKGVSLRNQNQPVPPPASSATAPSTESAAATPASSSSASRPLPKDFTPVKSSVLKGYHYDPEVREFHTVTNAGQHYIYGDVSPADAEAFEAADSKGKAWNQIRNNPRVANVVNGERIAFRPTRGSASPDDAAPAAKGTPPTGKAPAQASGEDLIDALEKSLAEARKKKAAQ